MSGAPAAFVDPVAIAKPTNTWFVHPKTYGPGSRLCRRCGNGHGIIRKYSMMLCRRCFRENCVAIGFQKVRWGLCVVALRRRVGRSPGHESRVPATLSPPPPRLPLACSSDKLSREFPIAAR
jgi:small subunit ribosomal protein S29e